jgi:uncharacterized protein (TIGR03086 family)
MPTNDFRNLIELDRRAVRASVSALADWDGAACPTPCGPWTMRDLVAHMTVQQRGFARAVAGGQTTVADWDPEPATADDYRAASTGLLAAFAELTDPSAPVLLPEIRDEPVPARIAVGFHLVDNVVHAWDVAVSVGSEVDLDAEVLQAAVAVARLVPDGTERERDSAAFAHALPVGEQASALDEILLLLGRDPKWSAG